MRMFACAACCMLRWVCTIDKLHLNVRDEGNGLTFVEFDGDVGAPAKHHCTNDVHHAFE